MNRLIVVGAGPAGLSLALQLVRAGRSVTLVEARRDFARGLRGDALMPCGLEALARMGLWELLSQLPQRSLASWSVWLEGRRLFEAAEPMGALQPCRLVPQQALLEALLEAARPLAGFDWQPGVAVSGMLRTGTGASPGGRICGVQLADGRRLEADLVVACDGRDSALRRAAGLPLQRRGAPLDLLWFQLPASEEEEAPDGFLTLVGGGAIASACRGATGELQLGWLLRPDKPLPQRSPREWADAIAALAPPALADLLRRHGEALSRPQRFTVQVGMAERWHIPGLLLLGDAAHPMSPIRAQGINMALRDSLVAARELLNAGDAAAAGLDQGCARIERLRRPEIRRLQALQLAEAQQGHWIGHTPLLRHGLAVAAPVLGPLARAVWLRRQRPLREGAVWL
jgi:2-polyprenyl-6-methoxyphenol hydroxylase-like FAD-dependent oxidoreductase